MALVTLMFSEGDPFVALSSPSKFIIHTPERILSVRTDISPAALRATVNCNEENVLTNKILYFSVKGILKTAL